MKNIKKILVSAFTLLALVTCLAMPKTAQAAGGKTITFHWNGEKWFFQTSEDANWQGIENIGNVFASGDSIVVDGGNQEGLQPCNITVNGNVSEFCGAGSATAILTVNNGTVNKAYAVGGTTVVNGTVNLAVPSGLGVLQVNGNVNTLEANYDSGIAKYGVTGTVGTAHAKINSETADTYYNILAGKMNPDANGIVWLKDGEFSRTPSAKATTPATTTTTTTAAAPAADANGLDKVPKTGSFAFEAGLIMLVFAAMCGISSVVILNRRER